MKRLIALLFVMALFSQTSLWAEDAAKADVFGGFSSMTVKPALVGSRVTVTGWQASVAVPLSNQVSILGDVGGQYRRGGRYGYEFLGGLQAASRKENMTLSVHALYGLAMGGGTGLPIDTGFMMGYGMAFDVKVQERMSFRLIQFDWLPSVDNGLWQTKQVRFAFGVVYHVPSDE